MTNHYKHNSSVDLLLYGDPLDDSFEENLNLELVKEDIDPSTEEYRNYPLFEVRSFLLGIFGQRTRDKILEEVGIKSFDDLSNAYFLYMSKELHQPARIREFVKQKYSEIIELVKDGYSEDNEIR